MAVVRGKVTNLRVKGKGPNSATLAFKIEGENEEISATSTHSPQTFSAMATLLTAAYFSDKRVAVDYVIENNTHVVQEVKIPA